MAESSLFATLSFSNWGELFIWRAVIPKGWKTVLEVMESSPGDHQISWEPCRCSSARSTKAGASNLSNVETCGLHFPESPELKSPTHKVARVGAPCAKGFQGIRE